MKYRSVFKYIIAVLICAGLFLTGGCSSVESGSDIDSPNSLNSIEQREEPSEAGFVYYPSGADFIESVIDQHGSAAITSEMRESFNLFARDYRWIYIPDMDGYESFFETTHDYASSFGYTNFADTVFYVLQYMGCPEKMSNKAMEDAIQSLFAAKDSYEQMPHQAYRKFANYEDGYYSPWPEGGIDHNRMFYLLTAMDVHHEASENVSITVRVTSYYFNDPGYEPGENEKWLAEKAKELEIPELQAAAELIASGEMEELEGDHEYETTMYIKAGSQNPQFLSSRSRDIPYDDLF